LLTATIKTPKLLQCTQDSLFKCVFDAAAAGLECDGRRVHLIPFENKKKGIFECQLIFDYKGLAELAMRSGSVASIHADTVCESDEFEENRGQVLKHKIDRRKPRGEPYAAYCIIRYVNGGEKTEVMSRDEIERIRDSSQGYLAFRKGFTASNPWQDHPGEMWKKTVAKRAFKWVPLSPEIRDAVASEDEGAIDIDASEIAEKPKRLGLEALIKSGLENVTVPEEKPADASARTEPAAATT
jgi:recombination protein RecT